MKRYGFVVCLVVFVSWGLVFANEWQLGAPNPGWDGDWYNAVNWGNGTVPNGETVEFRNAIENDINYFPITINGGTATTGWTAASCGGPGTTSLTITNGAIFNNTGGGGLYDASPDAAHRPVAVNLTINGGSTMNNSADWQIGRNFGWGGMGQVTVSVDGAGSLLHQTGGYFWLGWTDGLQCNSLLSVTDGASAIFESVGGLYIQQSTENLAKISVDGGTIKVKGDRRVQYNDIYKAKGWLVGWDGTSATVDVVYDDINNYTVITSVPEPATIGLFGLGLVGLLRRRR